MGRSFFEAGETFSEVVVVLLSPLCRSSSELVRPLESLGELAAKAISSDAPSTRKPRPVPAFELLGGFGVL